MKVSTDVQRSDFNNLSNTINYVINKKLFNLNTIMICRFIKYDTDGSAKYAEVEQLINNIDANKSPLQKPVLYNVPISYVMGGSAGIDIEYKENDVVIIGFSQQSLVNLKLSWNNGQEIPTNGIQPTNYGKFLLEDGVILGKISAIPPSVVIRITDDGINMNSNNTPIVINSGDADTVVTCKNATVTANEKLELNASTQVDITSPLINLKGKVQCSDTVEATTSMSAPLMIAGTGITIAGVDFTKHGHIGVTVGTGITGGVAP
jgi:hypothetical protein